MNFVDNVRIGAYVGTKNYFDWYNSHQKYVKYFVKMLRIAGDRKKLYILGEIVCLNQNKGYLETHTFDPRALSRKQFRKLLMSNEVEKKLDRRMNIYEY